MPGIMVNGIVSMRDKQPYIQLSTENGMIGQFTMAEARSFAKDIETMAARTEADAMVLKFIDTIELGPNVGAAFMQQFREFRYELDQQKVEQSWEDPDTGEKGPR